MSKGTNVYFISSVIEVQGLSAKHIHFLFAKKKNRVSKKRVQLGKTKRGRWEEGSD